jgi:hypothetical protein
MLARLSLVSDCLLFMPIKHIQSDKVWPRDTCPAGNAKEKVVAMAGMVVGVTVFGYFMGAMGSMLSKMSTTDVRCHRCVQTFLT